MDDLRLLVVDDNELDREQVRRLLRESDYQVLEASTAESGLRIYREERPAIVLLDLRLPGVEGMEVLEQFVEHDAVVIMLTGQGTESTAVQAMKTGAADYLVKDELTARNLERAIGHAEEVRRRQRGEDYIRALVKGLPYVVLNFDSNGRCLGQLTTGDDTTVDPKELVGKSVDEILSPPDAERALEKLREALESGAPHLMEFTVETPDGPRIFEAWIMRYATNEALAAVGDITERKQMEQRTYAAQRMEAIGRLAGGVAHDFNNMLTVIQNCVEVLREDLAGGPGTTDLDCIADATDRAARLTNQLLTFGRRRAQKLTVVDMAEVVDDLAPMLRRVIGEHVHLETSLEEVWPVSADRAQIEQIVMNLAINARDAMPGGGRLEIATKNLSLDDDDREGMLVPGDYTCLVVTDTGKGIAFGEMEHIFEPFYTTREETGGIGLGLATVHAIAAQSGGDVIVESKPGATEFTVYLPRAEGKPERAPAEKRRSPEGAETILLVEDDPLVRRSTQRILQRKGYEVIVATSGEDGLRVAEERKEPLALVITDVVMPGMSGPEFIQRLHERQPDTAVVFMSGYTDDDLMLKRVRENAIHFVQKPFSPDHLYQTVRLALGVEEME